VSGGFVVLARIVQFGFAPDVAAGQAQRKIIRPPALGLALRAAGHFLDGILPGIRTIGAQASGERRQGQTLAEERADGHEHQHFPRREVEGPQRRAGTMRRVPPT